MDHHPPRLLQRSRHGKVNFFNIFNIVKVFDIFNIVNSIISVNIVNIISFINTSLLFAYAGKKVQHKFRKYLCRKIFFSFPLALEVQVQQQENIK